jgi:hypothetical protein
VFSQRAINAELLPLIDAGIKRLNQIASAAPTAKANDFRAVSMSELLKTVCIAANPNFSIFGFFIFPLFIRLPLSTTEDSAPLTLANSTCALPVHPLHLGEGLQFQFAPPTANAHFLESVQVFHRKCPRIS